MNATMWYRWVEADMKVPAHWDFNHLEDGYDENRTHPTSKMPVHDKTWKGGKWKAEAATLENGVLTKVCTSS